LSQQKSKTSYEKFPPKCSAFSEETEKRHSVAKREFTDLESGGKPSKSSMADAKIRLVMTYPKF
jgi:hypothetical protein